MDSEAVGAASLRIAAAGTSTECQGQPSGCGGISAAAAAASESESRQSHALPGIVPVTVTVASLTGCPGSGRSWAAQATGNYLCHSG